MSDLATKASQVARRLYETGFDGMFPHEPHDVLCDAAAELRRRDEFTANVLDARGNGYELVCATCGCGIYDDADLHDDALHRKVSAA